MARVSELRDTNWPAGRRLWRAGVYCWLPILLASPAVVGCGGPEPKARSSGGILSGQRRARATTVARTVAVRRPLGQALHLSLWIDAGSRDAGPPEVATLAAWLAAARAGHGVQARVFADATQLSLRCTRKELRRCMAWLSRGLAARGAIASDLKWLLDRLASARRRAAGDESRAADALALEGLLGAQAGSWLPLGVPSRRLAVPPRRVPSRPRRPTAKQVARFLADHYGPSRTLALAVGDIAPERLAAAAAAAMAGTPAASRSRARRGLPQLIQGGAAARVGDSGKLTLVFAAGGLAAAGAWANALFGMAAELPEDLEIQLQPAFAVPVRGGSLAFVRCWAREPWRAARELAVLAARLAHEEPRPIQLTPASSNPAVLSDWVGLRWASEPGHQARHAIALGVVVGGPPGGAAHSEASDLEAEIGLQGEARRVMAEALAFAEPALEGQVQGPAASVRLENGARVDVRTQRAGERVAVAIRFAKSADGEPPELHGQSALLATLGVLGCRGLPPSLLRERLRSDRIQLQPRVEAAVWGLTATAPKGAWRRAVDLVLRCGLAPALRPALVEKARLRLRARLGAPGSPAWHAYQAARLLVPFAPGLGAPWGAAPRLPGVSAQDLAAALARAGVGARVAVAAVGPLPAAEAARRIARRLAVLPAGRPPVVSTERAEPAPAPLTARWTRPTARVLVGWRLSTGSDSNFAPPALALGADVFAAAVAARLGRLAGVRPVWWQGVAGLWGAGVAVALDVTDEALMRFDARVQRITRAWTAERMRRAVAKRRERETATDELHRAQPALQAERIATERLWGATRPSSGRELRSTHEDALSVLKRLRDTRPRFLIARSQDRPAAESQTVLAW